MMDYWQDFLQQKTLNDWDMVDADEYAFCALNYLGIVKVSGDDACSFLHNLSTNNFNQLGEQQCASGAFCNPKGRVLASFLVTQFNGDYYLCLPSDLISTITKHLGMYVLMSKVQITDISEQYLGIGLTDKQMLTAIDNESTMCCLHPDGERALVYIEQQQLDDFWKQLEQQYTPTQSALWRMRDIRAGFAWVYSVTSAKIIPQMLNLDLIGSVDFEKGCYPGQEIVARLRYLGKLKKRMYLFSCAEDSLQSGDDIYAEGTDAACGTVVDFCPAKPRSYGLVSMDIKHKEENLHSQNNQPLRIESDPYPIESESSNS